MKENASSETYYNKSVEEITEQFQTNISTGLNSEEASARLHKYGANIISSGKKKSILTMFLEELKSSMVILLLVAAIISGVIAYREGTNYMEMYVILIFFFLNTIIGVVQQIKSQSSLESLKKMGAPHSKVIRNGVVVQIPAGEIVPGDVVILEAGDIVPADIRLTGTANLQVQESALTGESHPVEKYPSLLSEPHLALGDQSNMVFSSGIVTYGRGKGIVVGTGLNTQVGKIARMLHETESPGIHLERKIELLGRYLGLIAIFICILVFIAGAFYGNSLGEMFMVALSLAIAAIPQSLPVVATIVMALAVRRMVKLNAIVRTLPSVEALGSITVICSDKTGTLTQNKMTVLELWTPDNDIDLREKNTTEEMNQFSKMLQTAVLCCDVHSDSNSADNRPKFIGDPTEIALVECAHKLDLDKNVLEEKFPRRYEIPFDSDRKRMSTINSIDENRSFICVKGGIDEVLSVCSSYFENNIERPIDSEFLKTIREINVKMAEKALRVLAIAYKECPTRNEYDDAEIETNLTLIGLLGMIDPPREEAMKAVETCKIAGIKPVMITGDHLTTAKAIAGEIGIYNKTDEAISGVELSMMSDKELESRIEKCSVFARVSPEHKVRIVKAWQSKHQIVGMTGDGVNDAPALKQANIGIAMGKVGTEVAKDASDIILTDDNFASIVAAIEQGRRIFDNIAKAIQFLLSCNVGELTFILIASLLNIGGGFAPLLPIQILWVNLVTDSLPGLALGSEPADSDTMHRHPRDPKIGIITKGMIWRIAYQGIFIGLITLLAFYIGKKQENVFLGQSMAFAVLSLSQIFHLRNLHSVRRSTFTTSIFANPFLLVSAIISIGAMLIVFLFPPLQKVFGVHNLSLYQWTIVLLLSASPILVTEIMKLLNWNASKDEY